MRTFLTYAHVTQHKRYLTTPETPNMQPTFVSCLMMQNLISSQSLHSAHSADSETVAGHELKPEAFPKTMMSEVER
ncbi:hypothetical protein M758_1G071800 [Ceratodon purpureus]|uniref:Uncharacterized protein n=1 Tax=Ceratodon purpureus TaxID=3225 RepID=A0A8T0J3H1_CERPU|nr:hypothetical protein KC19_1G073200 [Ceratodon purpureus]KAG0629029.1 hypothetical protein M758_1G071800 [Ceratodon purpureus]